MATTPATWSREALAAAPQSYFDAVDAMDVDAVLAHFAEDATLTVQTDHVTFDGAAEIRRMFIDPIEQANALSLRIGTAIANHFGAHG